MRYSNRKNLPIAGNYINIIIDRRTPGPGWVGGHLWLGGSRMGTAGVYL